MKRDTLNGRLVAAELDSVRSERSYNARGEVGGAWAAWELAKYLRGNPDLLDSLADLCVPVQEMMRFPRWVRELG